MVEEMLGVSSRKSNGLREKSRSVRQRVRQRPDSAITTNFESNGHGKLRRHKSRSLDGGLDQVEGKFSSFFRKYRVEERKRKILTALNSENHAFPFRGTVES